MISRKEQRVRAAEFSIEASPTVYLVFLAVSATYLYNDYQKLTIE